MRKILLTIFICGCALFSFSQDYSYSFKGTITPEKENSIISKIEASEGVQACKLRYKSDSERGEFLLYIEKKEGRSEDMDPFSPADIKAILLEHQLEPIDFRIIK